MFRKNTVLVLALMCLPLIVLNLTGCGGGREDDHAPASVDISGYWEGTWESGDNSGKFNFIIIQSGDHIEGTNTRLGRFTGNVQSNVMYIDGTDLYGIVDGNTISGVYTGNNGEVVTFTIQKRHSPGFLE